MDNFIYIDYIWQSLRFSYNSSRPRRIWICSCRWTLSGSKHTPECHASVDPTALGRIVFQDPAERRWLEQLVHPIVRERFDQELSLHAKAPAVVLMIPLLFEAGLESLCSEIWLVDCVESQKHERLITPGMHPFCRVSTETQPVHKIRGSGGLSQWSWMRERIGVVLLRSWWETK